jgi:tetratricopeptide (TPR) repeat protein
VIELQATTYLNMSQAFFQQKNFDKSIKKATDSLNLKKTIKAYYRRGKAYAMLGQYENAADDMKKAVLMDTSDPNDI